MSIELIILIVVLGLILIVSVIADLIKAQANRISFRYNLKKLGIDRPMLDYARLMLDENGLEDVNVEKLGFFKSLFIGNTYKSSTKTIRLSLFTAKRSTLNSLAIVGSLVGLANIDVDGNKKGLKMITLNRWFDWVPMLFVPLAIIGLVLDLVVFATGAWFYTVVLSSIGFGLTLFTFIISIIAYKTLCKSYDQAQKILEDMQILNQDEEKGIKKIYRCWKKYNAIKSIETVFLALYYGFKLIIGIFKVFSKK